MLNRILAIDPGTTKTAYCVIDSITFQPLEFGKVDNQDMNILLTILYKVVDVVIIEMISSFGQRVGQEIFETCLWIGRYTQVASDLDLPLDYIYRREEKMNLCGKMKVKDVDIRRALIKRFAKFDFANGKGKKAKHDFFYGFAADVWSAYAVGITYLDKQRKTLT